MKKRSTFVKVFALTFALAVGGAVFHMSVTHHATEEAKAAADTYYSSINWNQTGTTLKTSLHNLIKTHTTISYNGLYTAYKTTDLRSDGKIWDMYSDKTNYDPDNDRAGSYKGEGDCFNREHTIPQSVFSEASPMKTDIFHVYPTDGYVNSQRSNHPHANVKTPTYASHNNFVLVGSPADSGISDSPVCEPNDEYKGDFARTYFYFVTCYQDKMGSSTSWKSYAPFNYSSALGFDSDYLKVYLNWAKNDPVSTKEINRNEAAYKAQGNRNPFIDHPEAIAKIWDNGNEGSYTSESSGESSSSSWSSDSSSESSSSSSSSTYTGESKTISYTDLSSSGYPESETAYTCDSGIKIMACYAANFSNTIQMKNGKGYLYNTSDDGIISSIVLNDVSKGTPVVTFGSSSSNCSVTATNNSYTYTPKDGGAYSYFKVACQSGSALNLGSITVNYRSEGQEQIAVSGVSLNKTKLTLHPTHTEQLLATVSPVGATNKSVTWTSNNESVASVSDNGVVTAKKAGKATITVKTADGGYSASCEVNVVSLDHISVSGSRTATFGGSATGNYTVMATYSDGSTADVTSSAVVSEFNNKILGKQGCEISYTEDGITKKATISTKVTNVGAVQGEAGVTNMTTITPKTANNDVTYTSDNALFSASDSGSGIGQMAGDFVAIGSSKNSGYVTISLEESQNIISVSLSVKQYGSETPTMTCTIDGTSKTFDMKAGVTNMTFDFGTGVNGNCIKIANNGGGNRIYVYSFTIVYGTEGSQAFTDAEQASAWATYFLSATEGNCHDDTVWADLKEEYNAMVSGAQQLIQESDEYSAVITRYEFAVETHGMENFMKISGLTNRALPILRERNSGNLIALVAISLGFIDIFGIWLLLRKRKKN